MTSIGFLRKHCRLSPIRDDFWGAQASKEPSGSHTGIRVRKTRKKAQDRGRMETNEGIPWAVCQTRASFYAQQFQNSTNPSKLIFKVLKDLMAKRVIAGEICSDSHCEGLASFFHEKVQAIYRTFPTGSLMLEQVGRTLVFYCSWTVYFP
ncbi:hypothetical protein NDU88_002739 [Pleurodeles waltl]|uniref:Uncharacterized protein n=1 Tax=Pleurodeles waltl TaxID=8319 RepID=A0AAV7MNJ5_PLEWA|nr:hypothetical protein NDU88_002739 [Pleurodeles waltl]